MEAREHRRQLGFEVGDGELFLVQQRVATLAVPLEAVEFARAAPALDDEADGSGGPFGEAVDRVSTISSERGRAVKLALADGRLTLSVTNPDSGSATEELEVDYDATPLDIGFNARYLLDITAQLDGDTALLKLADPGSPTLIQDREGAAALYVLMPMRV